MQAALRSLWRVASPQNRPQDYNAGLLRALTTRAQFIFLDSVCSADSITPTLGGNSAIQNGTSFNFKNEIRHFRSFEKKMHGALILFKL